MPRMLGLPPRELPDHLLEVGRPTFVVEEARELLGRPPELTRRALGRLRERGLVFSPARGFWVVIPAPYRSWRAVPPVYFIDAMMKALGRAYYVALLSAASHYGACPRRPETLEVMCEPSLRTRHFGRTRIAFTTASRIATAAFIVVGDPPMRVATRELTAFDLVERAGSCGGLDHVAHVLERLGTLDGDLLARISVGRGRAISRRVGWMVERFGHCRNLGPLRASSDGRAGGLVLLDHLSAPGGPVDRSWGVRVNREIRAREHLPDADSA